MRFGYSTESVMAHFDKCPECGETNHYVDGLGERNFDCGFVGNEEEERLHRCDADPEARQRAREVGGTETEVTRFRLALLDAAHAIETIAKDMEDGTPGRDHAASCRDVVRQLREFAGHSQTARPVAGAVGSVTENVWRFGNLFGVKGS